MPDDQRRPEPAGETCLLGDPSREVGLDRINGVSHRGERVERLRRRRSQTGDPRRLIDAMLERGGGVAQRGRVIAGLGGEHGEVDKDGGSDPAGAGIGARAGERGLEVGVAA